MILQPQQQKRPTITVDQETKERILSILKSRPDEHIKSAMIQHISPVAIDKRTIAAAARELRREGHMVGSSSNGYYYTTNPDRYDEAIAYLGSRAFDLLETIKEMKSAQRQAHPIKQMDVFDPETEQLHHSTPSYRATLAERIFNMEPDLDCYIYATTPPREIGPAHEK